MQSPPALCQASLDGGRRGELWGLRLRRGQLDLVRGQFTAAQALVSVQGQGLVRTTPKTHEHRAVSLPPFLRDALDAHLREFTEGWGPGRRRSCSPEQAARSRRIAARVVPSVGRCPAALAGALEGPADKINALAESLARRRLAETPAPAQPAAAGAPRHDPG